VASYAAVGGLDFVAAQVRAGRLVSADAVDTPGAEITTVVKGMSMQARDRVTCRSGSSSRDRLPSCSSAYPVKLPYHAVPASKSLLILSPRFVFLTDFQTAVADVPVGGFPPAS
jgi:hypothetical protein